MALVSIGIGCAALYQVLYLGVAKNGRCVDVEIDQYYARINMGFRRDGPRRADTAGHRLRVTVGARRQCPAVSASFDQRAVANL